MTFMSILDVVENKVEVARQEETQNMYKCGLELEEGTNERSFPFIEKQRLSKKEATEANVLHGFSTQREALIQFGTNDWDDVIKKVDEMGKR